MLLNSARLAENTLSGFIGGIAGAQGGVVISCGVNCNGSIADFGSVLDMIPTVVVVVVLMLEIGWLVVATN